MDEIGIVTEDRFKVVKIVNALYERLDDVRRGLAVKVSPDDEFDLGINCRLANEEMWLTELLLKIQRS
jgi:hypothetical protein